MMVGMLAMAVMPPYATIGMAVSLPIPVAPLVQGFACGGESGSATALLVEHGIVALNGGMQCFAVAGDGALPDRIGRIRIMLTRSILMGVLIYPMFALLQVQGTAGILKAAWEGPCRH